MINKKFKYLMFIVPLFLLFSGKLNALTCEYSDGRLDATFEIKSNGKATDATINGELTSSDETEIEDESQGIENWGSIFDPNNNPDEPKEINMDGKDYYNNYKKCPPYAIFVDRKGQYDFAVSTESHLNEFKKYGAAKQGYAVLKLVNEIPDEVKDGTDNDYKGGSCVEYTEEKSCENNAYFACVWNETKYGNYCNTDKFMYVQCGEAFDIPYQVPGIISFVVNLLKIATPIILIIVSIISLVKAMASTREDEIKKAQKSLIRKIITAVIVFFVISIVQFVIMKVADNSEAEDVSSCLSCFLNNDCQNTIYYKTNVGGIYQCKYLDGDKSTFTCKGNK